VTYELYRMDDIDTAHLSARLGDYPDFDSALAIRDRDVIDQLTERPAPPREISHVIVGPGRQGPRTKHPVVTFAGADVNHPDPAAEIAATESWLRAVRAT
jgi:hypothetical protein